MTDTVSQETTGKAEIPATWAWSEIGSVAELIRGVSYKKSDASTSPRPDLTPILRANNIGDGRLNFDELVYVPPQAISEKQYVRALDVVIAMSSGSKKLVGKAGQATSDYGCGFGAFCGLVRSSELLDKKYVGLFFQSEIYKKAISKLSSGVNINNLRRQHIENMPIPLAPLNEQRRIVEKIEELFTKLDAGVRSLKQIQALLKSYRRSVLKAAVEGELSREWREAHGDEIEPASELLERILQERRETFAGKKYKEPASPDTLKLPALPDGWEWASPIQLASSEQYALGIGPFGSNLKVEDYKDDGVPLIFVRNIRSGSFNGDDTKYVTAEKAVQLKAHSAKGGDVLVTKMGDPPGDAYLYPENQPMAIVTADCIKWRLSNLLPWRQLFVYFINSLPVHNQILRITRGVAQLKVSLGRFSEIAIPLPPLEEQRFIVEEVERRISVVDKLEATVEENLKQAGALRQSILKQAFSGELVPQDPDDEPASVLLERIREERQATKQKAGNKRARAKRKVPAGDQTPKLFPEQGV